MALRFKCEYCGSEIITQWLKVGERAECKMCHKKNIIPNNATEIDDPLKTKAKELADLAKNIKGREGDAIDTAKAVKKPVVKKKRNKKLTCSSCGTNQKNQNALFCFKCGTDLYPKEIVEVKACPKCKRTYDLTYNFCDADGSKLELNKIEIDAKPQLSDEEVKEQQEKLTQPIKEVAYKRDTVPLIKQFDNRKHVPREVKTESKDELPMNWYNFVLYGQIPFGFVMLTYSLILLTTSNFYIPPFLFVLNIFQMFFSGFAFMVLYRKTVNSWRIYLFYFFTNVGVSYLDKYFDWGPFTWILVTALLSSTYIIPNYIYFNKRKHLFVN